MLIKKATKLIAHWRVGVISLVVFLLLLMFLLDCFSTSRSDTNADQQPSSEKNSLKSDIMRRPATVSMHQRLLNRRTEGFKVELSVSGHNPMTYRQFLTSLQDGDNELIQILSDSVTSKYKAVFWECNSVTKASLDSTPIQFVIIDAPTLAERRCDPEPFLEHFQKCDRGENVVLSFENLGKDAMLVVPCPGNSSSSRYPRYMTHLASFHRGASKEHVAELWKKVGDSMLNRIKAEADPDHKFWLSTSGLGVSWLHVRIDDVPKYYNYKDYKDG